MPKKKILYIYGGWEGHPTRNAGMVLSELFAEEGRFELEAAHGAEGFLKLNGGDYAAVMVYATGMDEDLCGERENSLFNFVKNGGGFIGIHSAIDSFKQNGEYFNLIGSRFVSHGLIEPFDVRPAPGHFITRRLKTFEVSDELYQIERVGEPWEPIAFTSWQNGECPVLYVKEYGLGRVAYHVCGHDLRVFYNAGFRKLIVRSAVWCTYGDKTKK